jgi:hypothetical protein
MVFVGLKPNPPDRGGAVGGDAPPGLLVVLAYVIRWAWAPALVPDVDVAVWAPPVAAQPRRRPSGWWG